jgi:uncharacterized protein (TIGR03437 family)
MTRTMRIAAVVLASALFVALLWAHAAGPDPRHTAAPGDDPLACATAGCHVGTPLNGGGGNVVVNFANGLTYSPGAQQTFTIMVTDPTARVYGFQMTARLESDLANGQAGDFTAGQQQLVLCAAGLGDFGITKPNTGCPANEPVQFIEHNRPFFPNQMPIQVQWTAPSTNVGSVHIYVAANAANGNGLETGDHIYTASYVLTPLCTNSTPNIFAGGVISAYEFNRNAGLASGTFLEIYGTNLSCTSRGWSGAFSGRNAPTSLDGVSVFIDNIPAYVAYVGPGQVNVQAPDDPATGAISVVVQNSGGLSNAIAMQKNVIAPALLAKSAFNTQGHQWVTAQHVNGDYVGNPGLVSGLTFRPAKAREIITIYGIGFGPVTPTLPSGVIPSGETTLVNRPTFRFGETPADVPYYGLSGCCAGLYQFNVVVPNVSPGDMPLNVDVGGVTLNQNLFITVGP